MMFSILLGVCAGIISSTAKSTRQTSWKSWPLAVFCSCPWSWSHIWGRKLPLKPQEAETKLFLLRPMTHLSQNQGENEYLGALACNTCRPHWGLHRQPSELSRGRRRSIPSSPIRRNLSTEILIKKAWYILNAYSLKLDKLDTCSLRWPRFTNSSESSWDTCSAKWISQPKRKMTRQNGLGQILTNFYWNTKQNQTEIGRVVSGDLGLWVTHKVHFTSDLRVNEWLLDGRNLRGLKHLWGNCLAFETRNHKSSVHLRLSFILIYIYIYIIYILYILILQGTMRSFNTKLKSASLGMTSRVVVMSMADATHVSRVMLTKPRSETEEKNRWKFEVKIEVKNGKLQKWKVTTSLY